MKRSVEGKLKKGGHRVIEMENGTSSALVSLNYLVPCFLFFDVCFIAEPAPLSLFSLLLS